MSHYRYSMLDSLMGNGRHDRMSWTGMAITGALVYFGTKMLMNMMGDND